MGAAAGAFSMLGQFGGVAGVAAMVAAFAGFGRYGTPDAFTDGFVVALVVGAGLAALGGAAGGGLFVRIPRPVRQHAPATTATSGESDQLARTTGSEG